VKILFISSGSSATIFALAPLATAARNAGHEVLMTARDDAVPVVTGLGLPGVPVTSLTLRDFVYKDRSGKPVNPPRWDQPDQMMRFTGRWFGRMAAMTLDRHLGLAKSWRPDLVVGGKNSYAAPLLAAHLGIPWVRHSWDASEVALMDEGGNEELRPELDRLGLDRLSQPDLFIEIIPPSIRLAEVVPAASRQSMRWPPCTLQRRLEPWMYTREARPRVCVTAGSRTSSTAAATPGEPDIGRACYELLRRIAADLATMDVDLMAGLPDEAASSLRGELSDLRAAWLPMDVVAHTCDLIVHPAGGQTTLTALNAGVPQLLLPQGGPIFGPAQRLADYGAAITLMPGQDTRAGLTEAAQELLSNPAYRERARALSREMSAMPPPAEMVGTLEKLAHIGRLP
jgi:UDP:flavonoid glycosyltransferase YjiC (YdhE family)